jgi:hypothetical protein
MNPPDSFSQTSPAPSSPQQTSPKGMWVLFAIIMLAAFAFTIYTVFFPDYQQQQLIKSGVPATAVILDADPTGSVYNSQPEVRLRLRVTPTDLPPYETEVEMIINPIYTPDFQPGKTVKVKYDKADPSKVVVEETETGQR